MANQNDSEPSGVAIIGMSCRFPGANGIHEFWSNLRDGVESITFFSEEELAALGVEPAVLKNPNYVKARPIVENVEWFDAAFFKISAREAMLMDPQHRLLLECAWEAMEGAGYDPARCDGRVGVYAGSDRMSYAIYNLFPNRTSMKTVTDYQYLTENDKDYLSTRISYKLNLKGPSVTVQTACSTALAAVHLACESLLTGECDMALAGAAAIHVPHRRGYQYFDGMYLSPDGHCRAFDARAQGTVFGSGVGIVLLKPLAQALADRDPIHAVIKGSAVNNDGGVKIGYAAPGVEGQASVIHEALEIAGVSAESIRCIETHGSGTELGDLVEITALTKAFRRRTNKKGFCAIGSVKTNIGHMSNAAGAGGLIKMVLALQNKMIPASLNFEKPNPKIDFENSPFYVNATLSEWKNGDGPRRAGVSSFGLGGTNAHVILEEAPPRDDSPHLRSHQLLILSARTETALEAMTDNLVNHLRGNPELSLPDVCYTLQTGRAGFSHRRMMIGTITEAVADSLAARDPEQVLSAHHVPEKESVVFLFPGVGDHYPGMGRELYRTEQAFTRCVDYCCGVLEPHLGFNLHTHLYPELPHAPVQGEPKLDLRRMLGRNAGNGGDSPQSAVEAQLCVFVTEYAIAQVLRSWGITAKAMIGYSLGEYVVACLAGVMSLDDALHLVLKRAQLIEALEQGSMLTVALSELEIRRYLSNQVALSAVLTPTLSVLAGNREAIAALEQQLAAQEIACRKVPTSHALHTPMMAAIQHAFLKEVKAVTLKPPQIPYLSNVSGDWIQDKEATSPEYWYRHLTQTVQFSAGLEKLLEREDQILLEVGPGQSLGSFIRQHPGCKMQQRAKVLASLPYSYEAQSDIAFLLKTLGKLWLAGIDVNWEAFNRNESRNRIPLPTYPFERQRYWFESSGAQGTSANSTRNISEVPRQPLSDWFYVPAWSQASSRPVEPEKQAEDTADWLVFEDGQGLAGHVADRLLRSRHRVARVRPGTVFRKLDRHQYEVGQSRDDYIALMVDLQQQGWKPAHIAHLWSLDALQTMDLKDSLRLGTHSLLYLVQAIDELGAVPCELSVISSGIHAVTCAEAIFPEQATLMGPCRTIPIEYPGVKCRCIDVALPTSGSRQEALLRENLMAELTAGASDPVVALRGHQRWIESFEPMQLPAATPQSAPWLRPNGVYLITGGLGGIGLAIAEYLARRVQARLVLISRSVFPPRAEWNSLLAHPNGAPAMLERIRSLRRIEEHGGEVLVLAADVADETQMRSAVQHANRQFGALHGVLHAAGVPGIGLSQLKTPAMMAKVMAPKLQGTLVLERILQGVPLDFLLLFSSTSAITGGGPGQMDYCAASAFLDAYAQRQDGDDRSIVSIDWGEWQWNAWTEGLENFGEEARAAFIDYRKQFGITFEEGMDAFDRVLSSRLPRVVVSPQDFRKVVQLSREFTVDALALRENGSDRKDVMHQRPDLMGPYVAPATEMEKCIAQIWQDLLAIAPVGVYDNFFEMGGNSLLGIRFIGELRKVLPQKLALHVLFEAPTVHSMAQFIEKGDGSAPEVIEDRRLRGEIRRRVAGERRSRSSV